LKVEQTPLPFEHHISRWCKPSHVDQEVVSVLAFMLEESDTDDALSVNWLEFLNKPNRLSEIAEIQLILSKKMRKVSKNSRIAVLNVGKAVSEVNEQLAGKLSVTILHNPTKEEGKWEDPSHSGIYGLTRNNSDALTAATFLRDIICEKHPATPL
jgi:hypothetical protein